jgi:hypothetical protein
MNIIGRTMQGGVIVEIELSGYAALLEAGHVLALLPAVNNEVALTHKPDVAQEHVQTHKPVEKKSGKGKAVRECAICGKPLPKDASPLAKTHKGKCNVQYAREYARQRYRDQSGKITPAKASMPLPKRMPGINPADPLLTDEERKAARLELIKLAAQRHADN